MLRTLSVQVFTIFLLSTLSSQALADVALTVAPEHPRRDDIWTVTVKGLTPSQKVAITLRSANASGSDSHWEASANFVADQSGTVDLSAMAPVAGAYEGVDPMGLEAAMVWHPATADVPPDFRLLLTLNLDVIADGSTIASKTIVRISCYHDQTVRLSDVRESGVVGTLFQPTDTNRHQGVLVFGGSEGGIDEDDACILAQHGYAALALGYFGVPGTSLPKSLDRIPLEYFGTALSWFRAQPTVKPDRVAVEGASRGGEGALLVAATFPADVKGVIARVPSNYMWGSCCDVSGDPSWTWQGHDLPFIHKAPGSLDGIDLNHPPVAFRQEFLYNVAAATPEELAAATIPVERIAGPVLLISGEDDQLWPSDLFTSLVARRLKEHQFPYEVVDLRYPGAGHWIGTPYYPTTVPPVYSIGDVQLTVGGTPKGYADAAKDSWPKVLEFLTRLPTE